MINENYHLPKRLRPTRITIIPEQKYTKKEVSDIFGFTESQMKLAEDDEVVSFFGKHMYGIYLFQYLSTRNKTFEQIRNGTYIPKKKKYAERN
jgi:hypothetical protein